MYFKVYFVKYVLDACGFEYRNEDMIIIIAASNKVYCECDSLMVYMPMLFRPKNENENAKSLSKSVLAYVNMFDIMNF